uniref:peptidylprolyl isomerase n=1 Tax=viral metagenome TaxID=1070528 RepID=A0A6C0K1Z7_9ZZZZ
MPTFLQTSIFLGIIGIAAVLAVKNKEKFITTESGIKYKNIVTGKGAKAKLGDTVSMNYTLWLDNLNGKEQIDSSYDRKAPLQFVIGKGLVIAGWDEILQVDMTVGTKREVIIPPKLGYGENGIVNAEGVVFIPGNATLYFVMELVSIDEKP